MAGEEKQTQQTSTQQTAGVDVNAIIAAAMAKSGTVGTTGQGNVYLGTKTTAIPGVIAKPGAKAEKIPNIKTVAQANSLYLNDPKVRANWSKTMRKYGLETGNPLVERKAWETAVAGASDWYVTSNQTAKITPEQYLQWWAAGSKKAAPSLPSRSIYQTAPEQLAAKINETAQSLLGRAITDADKSASWYKDLNSALNNMVMQGTVTTRQKVRNPQTGKMENVTIQKPEVTSEAISQKITETLGAADPVSAQRQQNLDIEKWFLSMRGNR
jgi:hypothetical protein